MCSHAKLQPLPQKVCFVWGIRAVAPFWKAFSGKLMRAAASIIEAHFCSSNEATALLPKGCFVRGMRAVGPFWKAFSVKLIKAAASITEAHSGSSNEATALLPKGCIVWWMRAVGPLWKAFSVKLMRAAASITEADVVIQWSDRPSSKRMHCLRDESGRTFLKGIQLNWWGRLPLFQRHTQSSNEVTALLPKGCFVWGMRAVAPFWKGFSVILMRAAASISEAHSVSSNEATALIWKVFSVYLIWAAAPISIIPNVTAEPGRSYVKGVLSLIYECGRPYIKSMLSLTDESGRPYMKEVLTQPNSAATPSQKYTPSQLRGQPPLYLWSILYWRPRAVLSLL